MPCSPNNEIRKHTYICVYMIDLSLFYLCLSFTSIYIKASLACSAHGTGDICWGLLASMQVLGMDMDPVLEHPVPLISEPPSD